MIAGTLVIADSLVHFRIQEEIAGNPVAVTIADAMTGKQESYISIDAESFAAMIALSLHPQAFENNSAGDALRRLCEPYADTELRALWP